MTNCQLSWFFLWLLDEIRNFFEIVWWNLRFFSRSFDEIGAFFGDWMIKFVFSPQLIEEIWSFFCEWFMKLVILFSWSIDDIHNFSYGRLTKFMLFFCNKCDRLTKLEIFLPMNDGIHNFIWLIVIFYISCILNRIWKWNLCT